MARFWRGINIYRLCTTRMPSPSKTDRAPPKFLGEHILQKIKDTWTDSGILTKIRGRATSRAQSTYHGPDIELISDGLTSELTHTKWNKNNNLPTKLLPVMGTKREGEVWEKRIPSDKAAWSSAYDGADGSNAPLICKAGKGWWRISLWWVFEMDSPATDPTQRDDLPFSWRSKYQWQRERS